MIIINDKQKSVKQIKQNIRKEAERIFKIGLNR